MAEGSPDQSFASRVAEAETALRRLRPQFLAALQAEWSGFMPLLERWLAAADGDAVVLHERLLSIAHNVKGQSGTIGLQDICDATRELWDLLNQCDRDHREAVLVLRARGSGVHQRIEWHVSQQRLQTDELSPH